MRNLKQELNHELVLKKEVHRVIKFNQKDQLKRNIDMSKDLKKTKIDFEKGLFKLINNAVFWKNYGKYQK